MVKIVQKKVYLLQKKVQMIITEKGIQNKNEKWCGKETNNILEKKDRQFILNRCNHWWLKQSSALNDW